jgi:hypothetical protein
LFFYFFPFLRKNSRKRLNTCIFQLTEKKKHKNVKKPVKKKNNQPSGGKVFSFIINLNVRKGKIEKDK